MILIIDNYDSFTYNLYQLVGTLNPDTRVIRNDAMSAEEIASLSPEAIILSPGPGRPEDAGICMDVVKELGSRFSILGVCLGHQVICTAYGAMVSYAKELMHGKQSITTLDQSCPLFRGCPTAIPVARYHSLAVLEETLPDCLQVISRTEDGEVMAVRHSESLVFGLQFHPESIMTPDGILILKNFLELAKEIKQ
ncbi:anthranilate synthase component 2 [Alkalibaculum bacchi]|uniref:Anthranilate synthase component 2 n=1 Tax=Alkalibaculum bacchi TaxID=645887 RepID=A0A366IBP4_9FIRM|nr:aminodeoxychorismate/anthranilate synthase component II [Alkalibaculum bacchi]RBP66689.1 anthranilate synthase component 2 [Alkalibaculum bacchi]